MVEKIALPGDANLARNEALPKRNHLPHFLLRRKRYQRMHVIGHEEKEMDEPVAAHVAVSAGLENRRRGLRSAELIQTARSAANRDEEKGA
ncbi:MAG: hypothetical protein V4773_28450 [Verrucomicrobiota bacterium]